MRDYVHVTDLAEAHVLALAHLLSAGASEQINLGTGQGASIREVMAAVERVTGQTVPHSFGPRRAGDPPVLVADPARALALLGWQPQHSSLERIVATAWAWHQRAI